MPIFVKVRPGAPERLLVTEEQAKVIEAEWTAIYRARSTVIMLDRYHLSHDLFRERRAARSDLRDRDIIWGMFNGDAQTLMKQGDLYGLSVRYYEMALFVAEEDRHFVRSLEACHKTQLLAIRQAGGIRKVEIMPCGESCQACQKLAGRTLTIDEALQTMPLPCKDCTTVVVGTKPGFCRCQYTAALG